MEYWTIGHSTTPPSANRTRNGLPALLGVNWPPMADRQIEMLQEVIQQVHGVSSEHIETVPVTEQFQGANVWEGNVEVFALSDAFTGRKCFAWSCYDEHPRKQRRYVTVLDAPHVRSAEEAVRASIVADARTWPN